MNYLKKTLNLIIALIGLNVVILIHEFGHFIFCKAFDVRTPTFSVGFDPAITYHKFCGTKFQLGVIPLGGYVSINQQDLGNRSYPKKMAIIFAGILFNFIFGFSVLYYLYSKRQQKISEQFLEADFEYREDNHLPTKRGQIIDFMSKATPIEAQALLIELSKSRFMGPIGIISAISQSVDLGLDTFIYLLATLSLNIGFFNLFPLSFLDGGQAAYFTLQALFGNRFTSSFAGSISYVMFALALLFLAYVSFKDIFNLRKKNLS